MKKRLVFHVGMGKTGSTALQWFFVRNQKKLMDLGIYYPVYKECLVSGAHHPIANMLTAEVAGGRLGSVQQKRLDLILKGLVDSGCHTLLLSSEFASRKEPSALQALFPDFEKKIVFYIRPQEEFIDSVINQRVKAYKFRETSLKITQEYFDMASYKPILDSWANVIGKENICLRRFGHLDGDLFHDFYGVLGCEAPFDELNFQLPKRTINRSLSGKAIRILALLNYLNLSEKNHKKIIAFFQRYSEGKSTKLFNDRTKGNIRRYFKDENERIVEEFLKGEDGPLF